MSIDRRTWIADQLVRLQAEIDRLMGAKLKGKARVEADARAEKLERRVVRLLRSQAALDAQGKLARTRAQRLARSKLPQDHAELILGALDELPIDLALRIAAEAMERAQARAGDAAAEVGDA